MRWRKAFASAFSKLQAPPVDCHLHWGMDTSLRAKCLLPAAEDINMFNMLTRKSQSRQKIRPTQCHFVFDLPICTI